MKAKGQFISFLLIVDTFFVAYAYGFHSRQVLIVDAKLPPVVPAEVFLKAPLKVENKKPESLKNASGKPKFSKKDSGKQAGHKTDQLKKEDVKNEKKASAVKATAKAKD